MTPAAYRLSIPKFTVSAFRLMKGHISFLKTLCRFCGKGLSGENDVAHKGSLKHFKISVDEDCEGIHPSVIGPACKRRLYRIRGATDPQNHPPNNKAMEVDVHLFNAPLRNCSPVS